MNPFPANFSQTWWKECLSRVYLQGAHRLKFCRHCLLPDHALPVLLMVPPPSSYQSTKERHAERCQFPCTSEAFFLTLHVDSRASTRSDMMNNVWSFDFPHESEFGMFLCFAQGTSTLYRVCYGPRHSIWAQGSGLCLPLRRHLPSRTKGGAKSPLPGLTAARQCPRAA